MIFKSNSLAGRCLAECLGTFILVFFGCGAVHTAILVGAQSGLWQVAIVWGIAVMLAIYVVGGVSGGHINPAMTVAFAVWSGFPKARVVPYVLSQVLGGFLAAAVLFQLYGPMLAAKEMAKGVKRGEAGSELTAMCYGEFYPNPAPLASGDAPFSEQAYADLQKLVPESAAILAEVLGTALLALVVFAVTDGRNLASPQARLAPVFIGLTVAVLISVIAPLTQACFNPARDLGPRLFAALAGWGSHAFPPGLGFLTVYIIAPTIGAVIGGGVYLKAVQPSLLPPEELE